MSHLQTLDGSDLSWPELHERVKAYYEEHDERGYPKRDPQLPAIDSPVFDRLLSAAFLESWERTNTLAARAGCHRDTAARALGQLQQHGLVERLNVPVSKRGRRAAYWRLAGIQEEATG